MFSHLPTYYAKSTEESIARFQIKTWFRYLCPEKLATFSYNYMPVNFLHFLTTKSEAKLYLFLLKIQKSAIHHNILCFQTGNALTFSWLTKTLQPFLHIFLSLEIFIIELNSFLINYPNTQVNKRQQKSMSSSEI